MSQLGGGEGLPFLDRGGEALLVGLGLLERRKVSALKILDEPRIPRFGIGVLSNLARNLGLSCEPSSAVAAGPSGGALEARHSSS